MHPILMQIQAICQDSYPEWVWQRHPPEIMDHIPVFRFHSAESEIMESQLRFLKKNGYQTVTTASFYKYIKGQESIPERAVMLTFDDGRRCVWQTVFPLLKKYHMKAVIFICPGIIAETGESGNQIPDPPALTWAEIKEMHESGFIDVQAHSYDHQRIPVSPDVVDFVNPRLLDRYYFKFEIPYYRDLNPRNSELHEVLGAPVYRSLPFLRESPMYIEDPELRNRCIQAAAHGGGEMFFQKPGWRKELMKIVREHRKNNNEPVFESESERESRISARLAQPIKTIESVLKGHRVRHMAYPWGIGSDTAVTCSRKLGYFTNFWSTLPHHKINRPGDDPFYMVRLKHDFIRRLPGAGRHSLPDVFLMKFRRRMSGHFDY